MGNLFSKVCNIYIQYLLLKKGGHTYKQAANKRPQQFCSRLSLLKIYWLMESSIAVFVMDFG